MRLPSMFVYTIGNGALVAVDISLGVAGRIGMAGEMTARWVYKWSFGKFGIVSD